MSQPVMAAPPASASRALLSSPKSRGDGVSSRRDGEGRARAGTDGSMVSMGSSGGGQPPPAKQYKQESAAGSQSMDFEENRLVASGGVQRSKGGGRGAGRRGKGEGGGATNRDKQQLIVKALLKLLQDNRTMSGVLYDVVLLPATSGVVNAMGEQGGFYQEHHNKNELGAPHLYIYAGMIQGLLQEDIGAQNKQSLATHLEVYGDYSVEEKSEIVKVCKVEKVYDEGQKRIVLCFEKCSCRRAVLAALVQAGGSRRQGRPPRGAMARSLEEWLSDLRG